MTWRSQQIQQETNANGVATFTFDPPSIGNVDTGVCHIPNLPPTATATGTVGPDQLPQWSGVASCQDIQVRRLFQLVITITNALPNTLYTCSYAAVRTPENTTPSVPPYVASAQQVQSSTGIGVLVFNQTIAAGITYTDTVLPNLEGIYHTLEFAVDPTTSGTVTIRLYDLVHGVEMWRYDLNALATNEVTPAYYNVVPVGLGVMGLRITVENSTAGNCNVAMWAAPDEMAIASVSIGPGGATGPGTSPVTGVTGQVSVTATATAILPANPSRTAGTIYNPVASTAPVFIGPSGVTDTTGYQLDPGYGLTVAGTEEWFGITASATILVTYEDE